MDSENRSRADLALPNPQDSSSVPEIELSEAPFRDSTLPEKAAPPPRQTWLTFLKRELEFLGFAISGFLSIMSEKKNAAYLVQGSLGANLVSVIAAGTGIFILVTNLKGSLTYINVCQQAYEDDFCIAAFFSTELVAMILFLTILGFGAAVLLIAYRIGELLKENQIPEDRLYEELNIYSPIYSELEDRVETSPTDT
uniref:Membrane spanning 4-domains A2 n=1 Tax=Pipistrellus kuhlii TaxID=59472 RepID=A0A7J7X0V1_PIPKU|nr:membrane spanning 4-domains A2 [Pipistrellus kuhlii]